MSKIVQTTVAQKGKLMGSTPRTNSSSTIATRNNRKEAPTIRESKK